MGIIISVLWILYHWFSTLLWVMGPSENLMKEIELPSTPQLITFTKATFCKQWKRILRPLKAHLLTLRTSVLQDTALSVGQMEWNSTCILGTHRMPREAMRLHFNGNEMFLVRFIKSTNTSLLIFLMLWKQFCGQNAQCLTVKRGRKRWWHW